ncbi:MAG: DnaJ C-terminal domain-containing protein [Kofleriaceae bacterium]
MADNLYEILGVAKTADADTIRKAYRKLAREHHPDVNPGDKKAEDTFKRVSAAYDVLSDEKKRKAYDEFGDASLSGGFDADKARAYQQWQGAQQQRSQRFDEDGEAEFDFSELFNRGGFRREARGPSRGQDLSASVELDLRQAVEGAEISLDLPSQGTVRVRIPPGADNGSIIRLAGKGMPGRNGGPAGDLVIETEVRPHPFLHREGNDLMMSLPVTIGEAYNGASVEVPTFDGAVMLKIPPRSQTGARLRLRGKGIARKDQRGDFYVVLEVRMPDKENEALAAALAASGDAYSAPVRKEISL